MDNRFQNNLDTEHPSREMLLLCVDGELPAKEAAQMETHLEACWPCRVKTKKIQEAIADIIEFDEVITPRLVPPQNWSNFDRQLRQLASEIGSPSLSSKLLGSLARLTQEALIRVKSRVDIFRNAAVTQQSSASGRKVTTFFDRVRLRIADFDVSRRMVTVPAALFLVFAGLIVWFAISPWSSISASEILSESERRTAIWENQPEKVLHWGYKHTVSNSPMLPDGKYTSLHWQQNTGGRAFRLNRLYDANGVLVWASWIRTDGSEVYFSHFPEDKITIFPSRDALRAYAAGLDENSRQTLENYVRSSDQAWQISPEGDLEIKRKYTNRSPDRGSVEIIQTADYGKVFRVKSVIPIGQDDFVRVEIEEDIAADSFRRIRNHKVTYYSDGKTEIEDGMLKFYQETSIEDFDAHDLSAEMQQVKQIVRVASEEVLKRAKQVEAEERNNRQAK